jgi:hypothetical protein
MIYMTLYYRFPVRIGIPIFLVCIALQLFLLLNRTPAPSSSLPRTKQPSLNDTTVRLLITSKNSLYKINFTKVINFLKKPVFVVLLLIYLFWNIDYLYNNKILADYERYKFYENLELINGLPKGSVIIPSAGAFRHQNMNALTTYGSLTDKTMITLGWNIFSPLFYYQLELIGLSKGSQILEYMTDNEKGYFITNNRHINLLVEVTQQKLGFPVCKNMVKTLKNHLSIYQLKSEGPCLPDACNACKLTKDICTSGEYVLTNLCNRCKSYYCDGYIPKSTLYRNLLFYGN